MAEYKIKDRTRQVLFAVVESYIASPEPVGSRYVSRKYALNVSASTIRNIMSDLEEMGYLCQPHTSAGRVPTDKGYRFYVDDIKGNTARTDRRLLAGLRRKLAPGGGTDVNYMLGEATRALSSMSRYLGVAVPIKTTEMTLNRIQLFRYRGRHIAAVLFTDEGLIKHRVLKLDADLSQRDLNRMSDYLNGEFSGLSIGHIQKALRKKMSAEKALCDMLISKAVTLCKEALTHPPDDLFVSGLSDFMELPDISSRIRTIAQAVEDKHLLVSLLDGLSTGEPGSGVNVLIGSENPIEELTGLSIVVSTYSQGGRALGSIGIIGPTRMDYSKTIPMVSAAASVITNAISGMRP